MSKTYLGIIFICTGLAYGSLAIEKINRATLGFLVKNGWLAAPAPDKIKAELIFGPRLQILFYAFALIVIGLYLIVTKNM